MRRKKDAADTRSKVVGFRLTQRDANVLEALADAKGQGISTYLRDFVEAHIEANRDSVDIKPTSKLTRFTKVAKL
jgi:hypothetical protein